MTEATYIFAITALTIIALTVIGARADKEMAKISLNTLRKILRK